VCADFVAKARQPVRADLWMRWALTGITTAPCVLHENGPGSSARLGRQRRFRSRLCLLVSSGAIAFHRDWAEIGESVNARRKKEIDIVISRRHVLYGNWQARFTMEICARCATLAGDAHVKAILANGELAACGMWPVPALSHDGGGRFHQDIDRQGKHVNAPVPVSLVMIRAIRDYTRRTGIRIGYKPCAGGIIQAKDRAGLS